MRQSLRAFASAVLLIYLAAFAAPASASNVLIVATTTSSDQAPAYLRLKSLLESRGDTVTIDTSAPETLSAYDIIYDLRIGNPTRTDTELTRYLNFLDAAPGKTLVLIGENQDPTFTGNATISTFITQAGGGIVAAPTAYAIGLHTLTPELNTPNEIGSLLFAASGLVTSSGTGKFGATLADGVSGSILIFAPGTLAAAPTGALVVVYDINFLSSALAGSDEALFAENLVNYVAAGIPAEVNAIPTLSEWAMILFALILAGGTALYLHRRHLSA